MCCIELVQNQVTRKRKRLLNKNLQLKANYWRKTVFVYSVEFALACSEGEVD